MNKTIINGIDVSECPCKDDDKCLEVPILNEYGDLIDYQDCEPQTLCPYRSKIKIQHLQEENEELKNRLKTLDDEEFVYEVTEIEYNNFKKMNEYKQALEEIREIAKYNQFYNPKYFMLRGNIGQIQNIKMTEIYEKCNEVLNDRD